MAPRTRMLSVLSWNVQGLNDPTKCSEIKLALPPSPPSVICLQEMKLGSLDVFKASSFLPATHATHTTHCPSMGASGGLINALDSRLLECNEVHRTPHSLKTMLVLHVTGKRLAIVNVYGPSTSGPERATFFIELEE